MKVSIRRHGIVIRMIDVGGDKARIGSGDQCEVRIDDPYLSAHVADLVKQANMWRVVDTGTSLEGVTRGGSRVEDEPVMAGQAYAVGGFELLFEPEPGAAAPRPVDSEAVTARTASPSGGAFNVPETMVESFQDMRHAPAQQRPQQNAPIPKTMFEAPVPPHGGSPASASRPAAAAPMSNPALQGFQPMAGAPVVVASAPKKGSGKKILLLAAVVGLLFFLVLIGLLLGRGKKPVPPVVATNTAPAATPTPIVVNPEADPAQQGDAYAQNLDVDRAIESWEKALTKKSTPELQQRFARVALEVGLVHAAANDMTGAKKYFEKVVKYGQADSEEVLTAKAKLTS